MKPKPGDSHSHSYAYGVGYFRASEGGKLKWAQLLRSLFRTSTRGQQQGSDPGRREQENVCALAQRLSRVRRSSVACWAEDTHM